MPLRTVLRNGDHVEAITAEWSDPNRRGSAYVVTSKARAHIRNHLKNQKRGRSHETRRAPARARARRSGCEPGAGSNPRCVRRRSRACGCRTGALLAEIGLGNRLAAVVARQLVPAKPEDGESRFLKLFRRRRDVPDKGPALAIRGTEGVVVSYARCCRPIPGDPVLGFLSSGRGIVVHTEDCKNVAKFRKHPEQWIDVQWADKIEGVFPVSLRVDVKNQRGVLASVAAAISSRMPTSTPSTSTTAMANTPPWILSSRQRDRVHLARIMRAIRRLEPVVRVNRKGLSSHEKEVIESTKLRKPSAPIRRRSRLATRFIFPARFRSCPA